MKLIIFTYITFIFISINQTYKLKEKSIEDGYEIYQDFCVRCHLNSGSGHKGKIPPLAKSDFLLKNTKESIKAIKYGLKGPLKVNSIQYNGLMESQGLDDEEIADVMNYILNSWGNIYEELITPKKVLKVKKE
tara:strand:- start:1427 stop:1825 length:399 start_codon:yes stop_codon:yes gene_type:complete